MKRMAHDREFTLQKQPPEVFQVKKLFLKISQYSQEKISVEASF